MEIPKSGKPQNLLCSKTGTSKENETFQKFKIDPNVIVSRVGKVEKVQSLDKKFKSHREDPLSVLLVCSWLCW
ncbi:hypothetical protein CEXT_524841 [Caerostris extrusa]|uniref:Uncharacterized protein n=1 Tax=Caerostris extrusa TaxID=172846 RepID=A0AAV4VPB7_CAEEX|nr:hypothetical protein CEXT_524841 [Caerostris extrusa]